MGRYDFLTGFDGKHLISDLLFCVQRVIQQLCVGKSFLSLCRGIAGTIREASNGDSRSLTSKSQPRLSVGRSLLA